MMAALAAAASATTSAGMASFQSDSASMSADSPPQVSCEVQLPSIAALARSM